MADGAAVGLQPNSYDTLATLLHGKVARTFPSRWSRPVKDTLSLQDLFHNRIFKVTDYQRGYAWEGRQVGEFLDDLALLTPSRHHYTGTVVLFQRPNAKERMDGAGNSYVETDIVDGQQRLTTTVLLLNEISKALGENPNSASLAQGIQSRYIETPDIDKLSLYKLSLNEDTDNFFKFSILPKIPGVSGAPVTSAQRLLDAKKQIAEYLNEAEGTKVDREHWLRELHSKVTTRLHFNLYEVEDEAEVGVIFEVMNDRGKQLTDLEKVKNYLLYAASSIDVEQTSKNELVKSVNNAWAEILKQLMAARLGLPANENQLLRAHWLMQYDPQSRKWDGSKSIRGRFDLRKGDHTQLLSDLHQYVQRLRDCCTSYCDALRPGRDVAFLSFSSGARAREDIVLWNMKLGRVGTTATFLPLLMAVRKRWPSAPERYLEILKLCETFAFRVYRVSGANSNYRESAMFHLAFDVAHGMDFPDALQEIKRHYGNWRVNQMFNDFTNPGNLNSLYGWTGLKYFLYEYEGHLASNKGASPKIPWADIERENSIEHVLPQSIDNQHYWQERFDAATHQEYKHDIGNLTLTKDNPYLSNKSFPDKKGAIDSEGRCYAKSLLLEERELTEWNDWTIDAIDERRAKLLNWAKERWHVDFSDMYGETYAMEPDDDEEQDELADEEGEE